MVGIWQTNGLFQKNSVSANLVGTVILKIWIQMAGIHSQLS
jgi:hypothetical protein